MHFPTPRQSQTASGKEATRRILFSHEGTDYLEVRRLPDSFRPQAQVRYLARPRTLRGVEELVEVTVLQRGASEAARVRIQEEAQLAALLAHPAIARVQGVYAHAGEIL